MEPAFKHPSTYAHSYTDVTPSTNERTNKQTNTRTGEHASRQIEGVLGYPRIQCAFVHPTTYAGGYTEIAMNPSSIEFTVSE